MEQPDQERVALEAKMAFLERTVELMNEVILEQARGIQELGDRLAQLERAFSGDDGGELGAYDTPPPHY